MRKFFHSMDLMWSMSISLVNVPTGYASQAKENCSESLLPLPGDKEIFGDDCRDYSTIIKNICGFLNHVITVHTTEF